MDYPDQKEYDSSNAANELKKVLDNLAAIQPARDTHKQPEYLTKPSALPYRRIGNTTRLVDYYIQELFLRGTAKVLDHHGGDSPNHLSHIMIIIINRLQHEHRMNNKDYKIDTNKQTITLTNHQHVQDSIQTSRF